MESSKIIKIPRKDKGMYPYFAKCAPGTIWLVKCKSKRAYVRATFVGGETISHRVPFEYECDIRESILKKIDKMRIVFQVGEITDEDSTDA